MPPAVAASPWLLPAVTAATGIGAAALSSRSANKANSTQAVASREALEYQKQQDAKAEQQYKEQQAKADAEYARQMAEMAPYREAALGILGKRSAALGTPITAPTYSQTRPAGWTGATSAPRSLSAYANGAPSVLATQNAPISSLSDIANWSDWGSARRAS